MNYDLTHQLLQNPNRQRTLPSLKTWNFGGCNELCWDRKPTGIWEDRVTSVYCTSCIPESSFIPLSSFSTLGETDLNAVHPWGNEPEIRYHTNQLE